MDSTNGGKKPLGFFLPSALLRAIVHSTEDALITVDGSQNIVLFNRGAERIFGYDQDYVLGKPLNILIPERFRSEHSAHVSRFGESRTDARYMDGRSEIFGLRKSGDEFPAEASILHLTFERQPFFAAVVRDLTNSKRNERALQKSLDEKNVLLQEVHHRVKNNLQTIQSLLSLQSEALDNPDIAQAFLEAQNRVRSIALVHERLYRAGDFSKVDFSEYVKDLSRNLLATFRLSDRVTVDTKGVDAALPIEKSIPCGLILNELLTNAFKHAFPGSRRGTVRVAVKHLDKERSMLEVRDDGAGLSPEFDVLHANTLGIQLIINLAGQLKGEIDFANEPGGLAVRIEFPRAHGSPS